MRRNPAYRKKVERHLSKAVLLMLGSVGLAVVSFIGGAFWWTDPVVVFLWYLMMCVNLWTAKQAFHTVTYWAGEKLAIDEEED